MPGFFSSSMPSKIYLNNKYPERCISETLIDEKITIKRNTLNKFMRDKAFLNNSSFACVSEGVILNLAHLLLEYKVSTINELIPCMYAKEGEAFFSKFIGSFAGVLYDKNKSLWIIWTNQVGDKPVFYYANTELMAGSQVNYLIDAVRECGRQLSFDEQAAYQMLTFGFMEGDDTYAKEIKRLRGGQYLRYQYGKIDIKEYYSIQKQENRFKGCSQEEIIEKFDSLIRKASQLEYAKDDEYGYLHLADLSGGLDARMNMWVSHTVAQKHIQFITYGKANYLDELIAKQLAAFWNDEILIKPLDDVSFLYDIDDIVFLNAGLSLYSGITGGKRMLEQLNMEQYGIEHTGQLNGGIIGSYLTAIGGGKEPTGMYSEKLSDRLVNLHRDEYPDHEIYLLYTRGFRGVMNTQMIRSNYTEAYSTSTNPEVMSFCLDIPLKMRMNHSFYKEWILQKYPDAANYKWEKINAKITDGRLILLLRKYLIRAPRKFVRLLRRQQYINTGMNPLDYWLSRNEDLRNYLDTYEKSGYSYMPDGASEQLIRDMKQLYKTGTVSEKTMVLTVLASVKLYFGGNFS